MSVIIILLLLLGAGASLVIAHCPRPVDNRILRDPARREKEIARREKEFSTLWRVGRPKRAGTRAWQHYCQRASFYCQELETLYQLTSDSERQHYYGAYRQFFREALGGLPFRETKEALVKELIADSKRPAS